MLRARAVGIGLALASALWCAPRVVFSAPAADPAWDRVAVSHLVVGPGGDVWVAGSVQSIVPWFGDAYIASAPFVTRLDQAGNVRWRTVLGEASGTTIRSASAVGVDGAGNAYVVGRGEPSGSQILNGAARPLPSPSRFGPGWAWLAKLDPGGRVTSYSLFGGSRETVPSDIAVGTDGSLVVVGYTADADFPTTPGAVGGPARQPGLGTSAYGFVMRFLPDAKSVVFSTCLGGTKGTCGEGASWCIRVVGQTRASAVLVDGRSAILVAGSSSAIDFLPGTWHLGGGYLVGISADGARFISATRMPAWPGDRGMRLTSAGHLVMGASAFGSFPTTPGAMQSTYLGCPGGFYWSGPYRLCSGGQATPNGYVSEVDFNGRLVRGTYLGGRSAAVNGVAVDASGHIWVSGSEAGDDFPVTADGMERGYDFLLRLDKDTFRVAQSTRLPYGVSGGSIAIGSGGELYLGSGSSGLVSRVALDGSGPAILGVASAASWSRVTGEIAPGELVSVYGRDIGPSEPAHLELYSDGLVGTDLGGSRLFFQGQAAPLLYAQRDQINAVAPFGVAGLPEVNVELMQAGKVVATQKVRVVEAKPAILGVLNPDGSLNHWSRPAPRGSVVSVYAAGLGDLLPRPADGEVPVAVLPKAKAPVTVLLNAKPAEVLYIGSAPGLVAGVMQVDVRAPDCLQCGLVLKVGSRTVYCLLHVAR